uniref:Uncharacterized protein n=1 Tax=Oryza glumipatula TaxID=40148 RepID=A0A0E0BQB2_9ORYZ
MSVVSCSLAPVAGGETDPENTEKRLHQGGVHVGMSRRRRRGAATAWSCEFDGYGGSVELRAQRQLCKIQVGGCSGGVEPRGRRRYLSCADGRRRKPLLAVASSRSGRRRRTRLWYGSAGKKQLDVPLSMQLFVKNRG